MKNRKTLLAALIPLVILLVTVPAIPVFQHGLIPWYLDELFGPKNQGNGRTERLDPERGDRPRAYVVDPLTSQTKPAHHDAKTTKATARDDRKTSEIMMIK